MFGGIIRMVLSVLFCAFVAMCTSVVRKTAVRPHFPETQQVGIEHCKTTAQYRSEPIL